MLTVVDLGCGPYESAVSQQVLQLPFKRLISVDSFSPYLELAHKKQSAAERWTITEDDLRLWLIKQSKPSVDVALMLDVLEHFSKGEGMLILDYLKSVVAKRIVLWLPIGECPQGPMDGNPRQAHKATWHVEDLDALGFKVQLLPGYHQHLHPPVDAAWARWSRDNHTECEDE